MKIKLIFLSLFCVFSFAFGEITLNGTFRNDALWTYKSNNFVFSDVVENKLIFSRKAEEWRFYADTRIYLLYGEAAKYPLNIELPSYLTNIGFPSVIVTNIDIPFLIELKRAFIRYDSPAGIFSLGKTYINFGNPGIFNPFELDKSLSFSDLKADKSGIFALDYQSKFWELTGFKLYLSMKGENNEPVYGGSIFTHFGNFDAGIAANRLFKDTNRIGFYFKGDIEVGVTTGYAYHFDDSFTNNWNEANLGVDYSFFDNKLFASLVFYYAEKGATITNDYDKNDVVDKYFKAKFYLYGNIIYSPDEFLSLSLDTFYNLIDYSVLFIPSIRYTLSDGLDFTILGFIPVGEKEVEFSVDKLGNWGVDLRVEAKL